MLFRSVAVAILSVGLSGIAVAGTSPSAEANENTGGGAPLMQAEVRIGLPDSASPYGATLQGDVFIPDGEWDWLGASAPTGADVVPEYLAQSATPFLLDPVDLVQCNVRKNANHTVTWWTAKRTINYSGGRTDLKCGTSSVGYKHIKERHGSQ